MKPECRSGAEESRYTRFSVVLMVNHACNLRCSYCYTGAKSHRPMPLHTGRVGIGRGLASVADGGEMELGFFGGEPLVEADRILTWMADARQGASRRGITLRQSMTTNGTLDTPAAREVMQAPDLDLSISCDGTPLRHDTHRVFPDGRGSSHIVLGTMRRLLGEGRTFRVVMVVGPDTVDTLPESLEFLHAEGVRLVDVSVDLWTAWPLEAIARLEQAIARCAVLWRRWLPDFSLSWFDSKAARLAQAPLTHSTAGCGFGAGEVAVAPSGRLYPCERLIGEDHNDQPMRLPGHVLEGADFLSLTESPEREHDACSACRIRSLCSTSCRCSNFIRTGDVRHPDGLLCRVDKACFRETLRVLTPSVPAPANQDSTPNPRTDHGLQRTT